MQRLIMVLLVFIALVFGPLRMAAANGLNLHSTQADASLPMPSSVLTVAASISSAGVAGRYLFNRRQR